MLQFLFLKWNVEACNGVQACKKECEELCCQYKSRHSKVDIDERKVDIDISESIANKLKDTSTKTIDHALALYNTFATNQYFGRSDVVSIMKLKDSGTSKFLSKILELAVIELASCIYY